MGGRQGGRKSPGGLLFGDGSGDDLPGPSQPALPFFPLSRCWLVHAPAWERRGPDTMLRLAAPLTAGGVEMVVAMAWLFPVASRPDKQRSGSTRPVRTPSCRTRSEEGKAVTGPSLSSGRRIWSLAFGLPRPA